MNKKAVIIVTLIILVIVGALAYVLLTPSANETSVETPMQSTADEQQDAPTSTVATTTQPGALVDYDESIVESTTGTKLLFFHASWCPQCRELEESIVEGGVPDGVTVFKVDYDSNQALRQKYGVTLQTTFVRIDDNGNKTASYVAYEEPQFSAVVRELL